MALDTTEVRLAPSGHIYTAVVGTTLPTTATMSLNAAFKELGYADEDGVSITPGVEVTDIAAWQAATPVKTSLDSISLEISFNLLQANQDTWALYFFNTAWANNFGQGKVTVSSNPGTQEKALIIEWDDDLADTSRLVVPRAFIADREALQLVRNDVEKVGLTFRVLDNSGTFFYVYSENADLVPSS